MKHVHDKNIAHRDIKPENVIYEEIDGEIRVKLIDFGLSKLVGKDGRVMRTKLGTPYYVSPEVLEGVYDKRCDLWAVGVLAYILLCGEPPFNGQDENEVFKKIQCVDYDYDEKLWKDISKDAQNFINKFLVPDPKRRMTSE